MSIKSISLNQLEGQPKEAVVSSNDEAIKTLCEWAAEADYYKGVFSITFDNGDMYEGNLFLFPNMENKSPLRMAKQYIEEEIQDDVQNGKDSKALAFAKNHFPDIAANYAA